MNEGEIRKSVTEQWMLDCNQMALDSRKLDENYLKAWLCGFHMKLNKSKNSKEREFIRAYICFFSNWMLHGKDISKGYEALDHYLINRINKGESEANKKKRPKRSETNSGKREQILGAALAVSREFPQHCKTISDVCNQIGTRAHVLFPDTEDPPLAFSTMEKLIGPWLNKFK